MVIIGLTGSIGTGKSTTGKMFAHLGIPVYDADATVHALYSGAAVEAVEKRFPGVTSGGIIDREKLAAIVLKDRDKLRALEAIVHPLAHAEERKFLAAANETGHRFVVLEIPLLLETGGADRCDLVVTTSVSPDIQRQRVLKRPAMTQEKLDRILAKQMPIDEKNSRAHFIVDTSGGKDVAAHQVGDIVRAIQPIPGWTYRKRRAGDPAPEQGGAKHA